MTTTTHTGTLLSGWCLPGMDDDQHTRCTWGPCPCACHEEGDRP